MAEPRSDLGELFPATLRVLQRRGSLWRWQVVSAVALGAASLVSALAMGDWRALLGLLLIAPLSGLFFALDGRLVRRWQDRVLHAWQEGDLRLEALRQGLASHPRLPASTLAGMLHTLPAADAEPRESAERSRRAEQAVRRLRREMVRALAGYAAVTLGLGAAAGALSLGASWPLAGLVPAFLAGALARLLPEE